ncbi:Gfo/Idh/MocA family protein [Arthrobacter sp. SO3]|uniref:Gfo/Idh/MocA family protein n=1 Tax=Arthrobacter sp. SO3 TaxID=1897057 RepID=UPI001CFFF0D1|nr:Gfo/Idh/MocA family oxidoreductase [Arthrobacter sp. SO3]MCB5291773.1 1,5-anhydro-D-fructose reductase [Arthrobacter sp. SO3]
MITPSPVTSRPLRIGIAGCGAISRNHVEAFRALDDVVIVGVCDIDLQRAQETAKAWGIPAAVTTVQELLGLDLDIISVCTPHPTHEDVVLQAATAGVHVLCEKPISTELASAERMVKACDDAGVTLGVLFQRRFWPAAQRIRAAIDDGTLGRSIMGQCSVMLHREPEYFSRDAWRGTWASDGGGVLMTQAIHYIDLLQWFMGEVAEVYGKINTYKHGANIEVEDSATAVITFTSGAMATLEASTAVSPSLGVQIRVTGETGASASLTEFPEGSDGRVDLWAVSGSISTEPAHPQDIDPNVSLTTINGQLIPHHTAQVRDFVHSLRNGREPAVTGQDATKALRILLAVYESSRTGHPVRFAPLPESTRLPAEIAV